MNPVVETKELLKIYDGRPALDSLTLSFPEGKVSGLLGPNGGGKSTLLKMIVGLAKPDSGSIEVFGTSPCRAANAEISYLPDRAKWYRHHTVGRAVEYASEIYPRFNLQKASGLLETMRLDPKSPVESLSKGHQACLMLSLCLARDTRLVLLDEPFSGIDLICRERIIHGIIDSLSEQKQTFIISTHEIYEAESLFENVAFLKDGRLLKDEGAESLRTIGGSIESMYRRLFR